MTEATAATRTIVTLYEEYGAGALYIGPKVAERLGVEYVSQAFSSDQIESAEAHEEKDETAVGRFFKSFTPIAEADASITWMMDALIDRDRVDTNTMDVLSSIGTRGGVILGRSSTQILGTAPGSLHVKIIGPVEERIARAAQTAGIDLETAERRQIREDRVRVEMSKRYYRWDPTDDKYFDLVVNTGAFTLDQAVDVIVQAYRTKFPR